MDEAEIRLAPRKTDEHNSPAEEQEMRSRKKFGFSPSLAEAAPDHPGPEGLAYDTKKGCSWAWCGFVVGTNSAFMWKSDGNFGSCFSPSSEFQGWHSSCHNCAARTFTCWVNFMVPRTVILHKNTNNQSLTSEICRHRCYFMDLRPYWKLQNVKH